MVSLARRMNMTVETDELGPGWNAIEPPSKGGGKTTGQRHLAVYET